MTTCKGAYACVAMLAGFGLIAFRDPNGIRPLGIASRQGQRGGTDWMAASESVVAQGLGFSDWEDVKAGELKAIVTVILQKKDVDGTQARLSSSLEMESAVVKLPNQPFSPRMFSSLYTLPDQTRPSTVSRSIEVGWRWETC